MDDFEPRIIGFFCNWCTYAGADLAGTSRIQYPPNIRVIRLMCSGALDPVYVIKTLLEGAAAILETAITRAATTKPAAGWPSSRAS
jgi:coenzyme F420-reducing hydrogenase delta subunit